MKKMLFFLLASVITTAYANELKSFDDIYNSLQEGNNIRIVINFANCTPAVDNLIIYTSPTAVMMKKDYIQFANTPLTTNYPTPPQPTLQNYTYKISNTNEMTIVNRIISLPDYKVVKETNSVCKLGAAVRIFN